MKTEEEARLAYCPFTFAGSDGRYRCIASECMAWRWEGLDWEREPYKRLAGEKILQPMGYCGLAGKS